jgi:hypothetical protein
MLNFISNTGAYSESLQEPYISDLSTTAVGAERNGQTHLRCKLTAFVPYFQARVTLGPYDECDPQMHRQFDKLAARTSGRIELNLNDSLIGSLAEFRWG